MLKYLSILIAVFLLVSAPAIMAAPGSEEIRAEKLALKQQQTKLHAKRRLLHLKQALNLQKNQMDAWSIYEAKVLENSTHKMSMADKLKKKYAGTDARPNSLELANANIERLKSKLANAQHKLSVFSDLYNELNEEQRLTVDKMTLKKIQKEAKRTRKMRSHKEHEERRAMENRKRKHSKEKSDN